MQFAWRFEQEVALEPPVRHDPFFQSPVESRCTARMTLIATYRIPIRQTMEGSYGEEGKEGESGEEDQAPQEEVAFF